MTSIDRFVAKSLIPLAIGVGAICFIAYRPFEKSAGANEIVVKHHTEGVLAPGTSEQTVTLDEVVISVPARHTVSKYMPGSAEKSIPHCRTRDLVQGNGTVTECE